MVAQFVKLLAFMPGNPVLTDNPAVRQAWAHWHSANWHSLVAEQGVGLLYGLGIVLALAVLATRLPRQDDPPGPRDWTLGTALFTTVVHGIYGEQNDGWGNRGVRFGPDANWRMQPILKSHQHR